MDNTPQQVQLSLAKFSPSSVITIEDKKVLNYFFIIREGKVRVKKSILTMSGSKEEILGKGDFFGVVGAMTGRPCIETAIAIEPTSLILCKKNQFGFLIEKNAPFAMKIIRSFSKDLRYFNNELVKRTTNETANSNNLDNLFYVGEYYYQAGQNKAASYIFKRYLEISPIGTFRDQAEDRLEALRDVYLSNDINTQQTNRIYKDGELLCSEFEPGKELFIIKNGRVKITKMINNQEILISFLKSGDMFGEMSLLDNKDRAATTIAYGDVEVITVNKESFTQVVLQNTKIATKLITFLSDRIWTIYRQLANLILIDPVGRLYDTLLTQLLKNRIPITENSHQFDFGEEELLKMLGLSDLKSKPVLEKTYANKIIQKRNDKIFCSNMASLQKEVEFARRLQDIELKRERGKSKTNF